MLIRLISAFLIAAAVTQASYAATSDVDLLVQRLVDKGILTTDEAAALTAEMRDARSTVPVQDLAAAKAAPSSAADSWTSKLRVKGDMRVRYQSEKLDGLATAPPLDVDEQDRLRIRWRVGVEADVTDRWQVGFGLASGGSDARSTNQTLNGVFSTGDARLDYAFARYTLSEGSNLLAGKFSNPLWEPKDLLWDSDIRPEGFAGQFTFEPIDGVSAFVTPAYLVLTEDIANVQQDANIWVLQAGATFGLGDKTSLTIAPTYYNFDNTEGTPGPIALALPTNTRDGAGNLVYDYDAFTAAVALTTKDIGPLPQVQVFGEWVNALDPSDDNTGYVVGASFGDAKVAGPLDWQFTYNYRKLERDAWPEFLGDSESFFGSTNFEGNEVEFSLGLAKNVWLALDYYSNFEFIGTNVDEDVLLVDLNLKW